MFYLCLSNTDSSRCILDLHGLRFDEALDEVQDALNRAKNRNCKCKWDNSILGNMS